MRDAGLLNNATISDTPGHWATGPAHFSMMSNEFVPTHGICPIAIELETEEIGSIVLQRAALAIVSETVSNDAMPRTELLSLLATYDLDMGISFPK